ETSFQPIYRGEPYSYPDQSGSDLAPTVGVTLIPLEGLQLYGLYTEGYRPPSIRESVYSFSGLWPNPDLKPERARNWELGINYLADGLVLENDAVRLK